MNNDAITYLPTTEQNLSIQHFFDQGQQLEQKSRAHNTLKRYRSAFKLVQNYCLQHQVKPVPLSPEIAYTFFVAMHQQHYAWSTLSILKSAIDYYHKTAGYLSPLAHPRIDTLLEGIRRESQTKNQAADPLTYDMLITIIDAIKHNDLPSLRDKALLLIGFAGGFRASELLALTLNDIQFKAHQGIVVTLQKSKTDQHGKGHLVAIPYHQANPKYCPIQSLTQWINAINLQAGCLFRSFFKGGCTLRKSSLSYHGFYRMFKARCLDAKLNIDKLSPHSLRSGFNTSAAIAGADLIKMREITNQSLNTQQRYIKKVNLFNNNANEKIYQYFNRI
jgi:site-specific recombinase XerD